MQQGKRIIIGSETEYGMFVSTARGGISARTDYTLIQNLILAMMEEGARIAGGVLKDKESITTIEEHEKAERNIADERHDDWWHDSENLRQSERKERSGMMQRRGFSGAHLQNGARYYDDMQHPEYSCPESADPYTAMCVQKVGDMLVQMSAQSAAAYASRLARTPAQVCVLKNNGDGQGSSYGGHENYLVSPDTFQALMPRGHYHAFITTFFVARQIITGAGKIGYEDGFPVPYQISQRADFFVRDYSEDTTHFRGIINARDYPYADYDRFRRFHVIVGDSNRSDLSLFLKFGITSLVLMMLDNGYLSTVMPRLLFRPLQNAPYELHLVSRDLTLTRRMQFSLSYDRMTALEFLRYLQEAAAKYVHSRQLPSVWQRVVDTWRSVLEGLEGARHAHLLARSLDWVAVERVLKGHMKRTGGSWDSEQCRTIEYSYRTLAEDSVFAKLIERGQMEVLAKADDVKRYLTAPPDDTRAWIRAEILRRYASHVDHTRWDLVYMRFEGMVYVVHMPDPTWGSEQEASALFEGDPPLEEFLVRVSRCRTLRIERKR